MLVWLQMWLFSKSQRQSEPNFEIGRKSDSSVSVTGALGGSGHSFFNWDFCAIIDQYFGLSSWKP